MRAALKMSAAVWRSIHTAHHAAAADCTPRRQQSQ
jgi:hypothetical protein